MELANTGTKQIRQALRSDAAKITRLLRSFAYTHIHSDWRLPADWIGSPGFVMAESMTRGIEPVPVACLAVIPDPPPAAWVRIAAVESEDLIDELLTQMLERTLPFLHDNGVKELGWLVVQSWPERWLRKRGFEIINRIMTLTLDDLNSRDGPEVEINIRRATVGDIPALVEIENLAFEPLWRHSEDALSRAFQQALSFDLAELDGRPVGFQYSVLGSYQNSAHLVRIAVAPDTQGKGVGTALMNEAFRGYKVLGLSQVSLNTQTENSQSLKLYDRFGFEQVGYHLSVWRLRI